ncbi:hypothetical protein A5893_08495 [Pedobacter psychrophilus]|uniref:DinB-like domain-containing protein n=1 Tax=Pedobacter psychrophilus TaxID=1826909 RepID=A0A179DFZ1_9SPHI|nr:DinB family protein [Pedobacter psychrophilus]OAQ39620.1 hypothetical protein A5893_08495 [Pedobacter psychrophilus]
MTKQFEIFRKTRIFALDYIKDLTTDQLNEIPKGFNNNIIWNLAHLISTPQAVCYYRLGLPIKVDENIFNNYRNGTLPQPFVNSHQIEEIKNLLIKNIDDLEQDYIDGLFHQSKSWTTKSGIELVTIEDNLKFLIWHDGTHIGVIMAMKKLVV